MVEGCKKPKLHGKGRATKLRICLRKGFTIVVGALMLISLYRNSKADSFGTASQTITNTQSGVGYNYTRCER
jgi:hypothetical protein